MKQKIRFCPNSRLINPQLFEPDHTLLITAEPECTKTPFYLFKILSLLQSAMLMGTADLHVNVSVLQMHLHGNMYTFIMWYVTIQNTPTTTIQAGEPSIQFPLISVFIYPQILIYHRCHSQKKFEIQCNWNI